MRESRERRERDEARRLADQMRRKGELEAANKHEAALVLNTALLKWKFNRLNYGWKLWRRAFLRLKPPPTLEEYIEMELARDQEYQLRGVKMRRKLRLYGVS